jgi:hypothetical protein
MVKSKREFLYIINRFVKKPLKIPQFLDFIEYIERSHFLYVDKFNDYIEEDIGYKNIKLPDGKFRQTRVTKITDADKNKFYVLNNFYFNE